MSGRTFGDTETIDAELATSADENDLGEVDDNDENPTDDTDDAADTADDDDTDVEVEVATTLPEEVWGDAMDNIRGGIDNDPAEFAKTFVATGTKDPQGKLNELSAATMASLAHDNEMDRADKGMIFSEITLLVEAANALFPAKTTKAGTTSDPKAVAHENAVRLYAVRAQMDEARENVDKQLRDQCIMAGLTTSADLDKLDEDGFDFDPDLDIDNVTFTKKFAESLDYIQSVPGQARGKGSGGGSKGDPFVVGETRYDSKGNACRCADNTEPSGQYFFTPKGGVEQAKPYGSPSTMAKKEVTGSETNGRKHFHLDTAPTS